MAAIYEAGMDGPGGGGHNLRVREHRIKIPVCLSLDVFQKRADPALLLQGHFVGDLFTASLVNVSPPHSRERFPLRIPQMGDAAPRIGTVSRIYTFLGVLLAAGPG
jgi:hypothetical protein